MIGDVSGHGYQGGIDHGARHERVRESMPRPRPILVRRSGALLGSMRDELATNGDVRLAVLRPSWTGNRGPAALRECRTTLTRS